MSRSYYDMRDAKVRIAHELMNRGWEVLGYHADESDSMTDYYSPAYWNGIATKNGYILVVDNSTGAEATEIKKYNPKGNLSFEDREKITKLEAMTTERGATAGEEANAKALIEKIQQKVSSEPAYEVVGMSLAHMANPGKCKWHIEKDGKLYDKGTGITKYADMPNEWQFDINKMEFKEGYKYYTSWNNEREERTITDEQKKIINDFKALILRFERVAMGLNSCGDGTAETESKATEQQQKEGYEKVIKQVKKTVLKMVEVDRKNILVGDYLSMKHHGGFWLVTDAGQKEGTWKINGVSTKQTKNTFSYESVGAASRGYKQVKNATRYYQWEDSLLRDIEAGTTKIFELKEVEEIQEVESWEKIDKTQKTYNSKPTAKQEEKQEQPTQEQTEQTTSIINHKITITADTDTRDNSDLWVVKIIDKLSNEEYKKVAEQFKALKGYYSKFKKGFIFKYDPTSLLKGNNSETEKEQTAEEVQQETTETNNNNITVEQPTNSEDPYKQQEIEDGFIYDCHFKEWDLTITEIQSYLTVFEIPYIDMGCKFGFKGLTADKAKEAKSVSDINGSIFFIDAKTPITADNSTTEEQPEETTQETETNNIIDLEQYKDEYKNNKEGEEVENINNEYNNETLNIDDIFNTFDNIEINNNSRISAEDESYCKAHYQAYNSTLNTYKRILNDLISLYNEQIKSLYDYNGNKIESYGLYVSSYGDISINNITKAIISLKSGFISKICYYFEHKYNISIENEKIYNKYKDIEIEFNKRENRDKTYNKNLIEYKEIDYNTVIDEIFIQLGGYSFDEKAVKEIKDKMKKEVEGYQGKVNAQIKNKKVVLDSFFYIDSWDKKYGKYRVSYNSDKSFYNLLTAISHFEQGATENCYKGVYKHITDGEGDTTFCEHSLMCDKAETLKLYKNGKVEITFLTSEYARQFAKEYCGYTEQNTKTA